MTWGGCPLCTAGVPVCAAASVVRALAAHSAPHTAANPAMRQARDVPGMPTPKITASLRVSHDTDRERGLQRLARGDQCHRQSAGHVPGPDRGDHRCHLPWYLTAGIDEATRGGQQLRANDERCAVGRGHTRATSVSARPDTPASLPPRTHPRCDVHWNLPAVPWPPSSTHPDNRNRDRPTRPVRFHGGAVHLTARTARRPPMSADLVSPR